MRKRARTKKGRYVADDKSTTSFNEAWIARPAIWFQVKKLWKKFKHQLTNNMTKCKNCNCNCHCSLKEHGDMYGLCNCNVCEHNLEECEVCQ